MNIEYFVLPRDGYDIKCKLYYPDIKPKGIVVGVHGFGGDKESSALSELAKAMENSHALLCFDFPAHGESEAPDSMLRVQNCVEDLAAVFTYADNRFPKLPISLFATSFGGYISILTTNFGKIKPYRLILRAPAVRMDKVFKQKLLGDGFARFEKDGFFRCGFERKFDVSWDFYVDLCENKAFFASLDVPTLMFCATEDELVELEDLHGFAEGNALVTAVDVVGAGHRFKGEGELSQVIARSALFIQ